MSLYFAYRALLACGIFALGLADASGAITVTGYDSGLLWLSGIWLASAFFLGTLWFLNTPWSGLSSVTDLTALAVALFDLVMIAFLVRLGHELGSGLPLFYLVTVATSAALIKNRITASAVAALATLAVLSDSAYQLQQGIIGAGDMLSAALLCVLIFVISLLLQFVVGNMATIAEVADAATTQIATLEELNEQVIAHMSTGICRILEGNRLVAINQAGASLLELPALGTIVAIEEINQELANTYHRWRAGEHIAPSPFKRTPESRTLLPKIISIGHDFDTETLLFIEDFTPVTEAAPTLKLNSLGKLTASIAHEIRNPLTAISHAAQLLEDTAADPAELRTLRDIVINNTHRVNEIIENILQLSRREGQKKEPLDLLEWLGLFLSEYEQGQANVDCVTLLAEVPVGAIEFDPGNLRRVLTNLLDNGIRHAGEQTGSFSVTLSLTEDRVRNRIHMDVIDRGAGVPDDLRERLFEPFFTTSLQGSGLGLYLCRELCDSNGAILTYDRTDCGETRFRVSVPINSQPS
ncbi:MAG: ATP-binding protein [Luminiphilus sp.]|nr:ATP-binding protein [Luminiphilus sp.]